MLNGEGLAPGTTTSKARDDVKKTEADMPSPSSPSPPPPYLITGEAKAVIKIAVNSPSQDWSKTATTTTWEEQSLKKGSCIQRLRAAFKGDVKAICLLLFLYLLQGIPVGLIMAIPLILQGKNASLGQQAVFSFAAWPYSLKLLWAPIVDSVYWRRLGRRKTWMLFCQYLIGIFMIVFSYRVPNIIGDTEHPPDVAFLTAIFFMLNFLAATQDVAVDGWALTMLSSKNVGHASTCNAVGLAAGVFLGYTVFLALESADFANTFLRSPENRKDYGLVDMPNFVFFWGIVLLVFTTLVLIFKKEVDRSKVSGEISKLKESKGEMEESSEPGVLGTYKTLFKILLMKQMLFMIVFLVSGKIPFGATDSVTDLKLAGLGMPKDRIAGMVVFLTPLRLTLPWIIGKYTTGPRPLNIFLISIPMRLLVNGLLAGLLYWTPSFRLDDGSYPITLYAIWIVAKCLHGIGEYTMFVSLLAFFAQISDPRIGGTYMTLLNTLNNLGTEWPRTSSLWLTDKITLRGCVDAAGTAMNATFACNTREAAEECTANGGLCAVRLDGYYVVVAMCTIFGAIWFAAMFGRVRQMQRIPRKDWNVALKT